MEQEIQHREAWLEQGATFLSAYMIEQGLPETSVRVSCGWPSRGGLATRRTVIGQCIAPDFCIDGKPQIFISPLIADDIEVLGVLLHELIHASIGCDNKHGKKFSRATRKVGLVGPPTRTKVGDALRPLLQNYVERVGAYPHAAIQPKREKKVGSRLRLYQCACEPPVKARVASDNFQARCLVCKLEFSKVAKDVDD